MKEMKNGRRLGGFLLAWALCFLLPGPAKGAAEDVNVLAQALLPAEGGYTAQVTADGLLEGGETACYGLTALVSLEPAVEGLSLESLTVLDSDATAVTVLPLGTDGKAVGVQSTLLDGMDYEAPQGTNGLKLSFFSDDQDFRLLSSGFRPGALRLTVAYRGEQTLRDGETLSTVNVVCAYETRATDNAAGQPDERTGMAELKTASAPTREPDAAPTAVPTAELTAAPTIAPTAKPTTAPTAVPTASPTPAPTATPVPGASLLFGPAPLLGNQQVALASAQGQWSAQTDADGSFRFDDLAAGDYNVYVSLPKGGALAEGSPWGLTQEGDMLWTAVTLAPGQSLTLPAMELTVQTRVEGCAYVDENQSLTREDGETLMSGVNVTLERLENGAWTAVEATITDQYGAYAFHQPTGGEYRVLAQADAADYYAAAVGATAQYEGRAAYSQSLVLADGETSANQADISLQRPAGLTFQAVTETGLGVLGARADVLDGASVLATATTDSSGSAALYGVRPGEHTLRLTPPDGYGFVDASEQTLTFTAAETQSVKAVVKKAGSFSGKVFEDLNNDGVMDEGDPGVAGVVLRLVGQRSGSVYELTTDETGLYRFSNLPNERYSFTADLPEGMLFARYSKTGGDLRSVFSGSIVTREFAVKNDESVANKNVGVVQNGVLKGSAFFDLNYNGLWDEGEPGYANVTVEAIKINVSESMGKSVTGEDGSYRLEGLRGGDYRLRAVLPNDGSVFTVLPAEGGEAANRFEQRAGRRENSIQPITILSGTESEALIGVAMGATVEGVVFQDVNYNGRLDGDEKRISGVTVQAVDENGTVVASANTGSDGQYTLKGIMPGTYTVKVERVKGNGFTRLRPNEEGGSFIVELLDGFGVTAPMEISMAQTVRGVNAGMLPSATVTGVLFNDLNDDGLLTPGEAGMAGATARLVSEDQEIDLTRAVGEDGQYFFDGVMPGQYTLTYSLPEHTEIARVAQGGNTLENQGQITATQPFQVSMGESYQCPLVGAVVLGSFEGTVFMDSDATGVKDGGKSGLAGAVITLTPDRAAAEEQTATTGKDGAFSLLGLRPAGYKLTVTLPDGYILSKELTAQGLPFEAQTSQTLSCPWTTLVNRETKPVGAVKPGSVAGQIWLDENKDGKRAQTEALMESISLELVSEATGSTVARTKATADGFLFANVRPGVYTVRFSLPKQAQAAQDAESAFTATGAGMEARGVVVAEGQKVENLNTGLVSQTSVGGKLWLEENGQKTPLPGVTVTLAQDGQPDRTAVTGESGSYQFDGLWPDTYTLKAALPTGMIFVRPGDANFPEGASVIHTSTSGEGSSEPFALEMAKHQLDRNIIYIKPAKVGDQVWLDENRNGLIDGGERMLPGVRLALVMDGEPAYETVSDASGYYLFDAVYPGTYTLTAEAYPELTIAAQVEKLRVISSCLVSGDGNEAQSDAFSVESGSVNLNFKVGYVLRDGQSLPAALTDAPQRDWTVHNQKYTALQEN